MHCKRKDKGIVERINGREIAQGDFSIDDENFFQSHSLTLPSYAKINLGLRVLRERADGYHEIETVFQQISLQDTITVQAGWAKGSGKINLTTNHPGLPTDSNNLAVRAAEIFQENIPKALFVRIALQKKIPSGAGLGGGSSNAASVLLALNRLAGGLFDEQELQRQATQLGADVPFFIRGGMAHATGIGEKLTSIDQKMRLYVVVVVPEVSISTSWAYTNLRIRLTNTKNNFNLAHFFRMQNELPKWRSAIRNDFEPLVFGNHEKLRMIKERLYAVGAKYASLSGSGSALYGIFDREEKAHNGVNCFRPHYSTFLTKPVQHGIEEINS